jgi:hypothetical protein
MSTQIITAPRKAGRNLDTLGMTASLLCAVHCALTPAAMALLPMAGLGFPGVEATEYGLVGLSATLGIVSLTLGYRRHRSGRALGALSGGLTLLTLGRVTEACGVEAVGVVSAVAGGCVVAVAHIMNRRLYRACSLCRQRPGAIDPRGGVDSSEGEHQR